ncbi:MAG: ABC transporter permease [Candidatus Nanopelagicales bacterium]
MRERLLVLLATIVAAVMLTFLIVKLMPGDPVTVLANELMATQGVSEQVAIARATAILNYDPNQPVWSQFANFVSGLLRGDLGTSIRFAVPVTSIMAKALPWTLLSAGTATILSYWVGTRAGLRVAWARSPRLNAVTDVLSSIFGSIPDYILGFFLISIFAVNLGLLPARGAHASAVTPGLNLDFLLSVIQHAILPVASIFIVYLANWVVNMRGASADVMGKEFIKYARARGLSDSVIRTRYVGKNARLPMITSLGTTFGFLIGGAPLIENLFSYPGVGFFLNTAVGVRDIPLMQGMFFLIIVTVVISNFIVDILYGFLDPRLRKGKA